MAVRHAVKQESQRVKCSHYRVTADQCVTRYTDATALRHTDSPCHKCADGCRRRSQLARDAFEVVTSHEAPVDTLRNHIEEVIAGLERPALAAHVLREAMRRAVVAVVPPQGGRVLVIAREMNMERMIKRVRRVE